jgi:hypothetical protein
VSSVQGGAHGGLGHGAVFATALVGAELDTLILFVSQLKPEQQSFEHSCCADLHEPPSLNANGLT